MLLQDLPPLLQYLVDIIMAQAKRLIAAALSWSKAREQGSFPILRLLSETLH